MKRITSILVHVFVFIALFAMSFATARSQTNDTSSILNWIEPGEYSVGFQLRVDQDYSRVVTGGLQGSPVHPRPIRTYLWYPAREFDIGQTMRFADYARLASNDIWPTEIVGDLHNKLEFSRRPLARSLGRAGYEALLNRAVLAKESAEAMNGPFPLIVFAQGLYYESPIAFAALAEFLAGQGFVVATCPLVGTNSPIVKIDLQGLETQVRDLEFVIGKARENSFVSNDKLGVFGFDMGGMAGVTLTMRNSDVDAFVSVSSGILFRHPSGVPMDSPYFDPLALRVPWLHSVPIDWIRNGASGDTESLFDLAIYSDRYLLLTQEMGHVDYTSYALIKGRREMAGYWAPSESAGAEGHKEVARYISAFFGAYLNSDPAGLNEFSIDPANEIPDRGMTLEHRSALPASITFDEFVQAVVAGQAEIAIGAVRSSKDSHPDHALLQENYLERLVWSLSNTWGLTAEVLPVIEFWIELYPTSNNAQVMLAETHAESGNIALAIQIYEKLSAAKPNDNYFTYRLETLQSQ